MKRISSLFILMASAAALISCGGTNDQRTANNTGKTAVNSEVPMAAKAVGTVYTADEKANSVSVINLSDNSVTSVPVTISPHNVQISNDGKLLLAVGAPVAAGGHENHGDHGAMGGASKGKLLVFQAADLAAGPTAEIEVGAHPAHVVIDKAGQFAYVANSGDDNVSVIDVNEKRVVQTIATGDFPHGLRISPDGKELYVADLNEGTVSVIDLEARKEAAKIPVGKSPVQVGFTPDGKHVYVSLRDENSVAVIDTAARKRMATITVGDQPVQVFASQDGKFVFVANQGTAEAPANTVSVIDTASNTVSKTITVGKGAHGVVLSEKFVYVSDSVDDTVSVIDISTMAVTATIKVGAGPNGITLRLS
ncbi:MAG TPA: beta-propeller fold lactonase family protein [Pyrinomonadaceae bacterium]|nr:beta-propeller fold lactonase family protein [Pyrinomonadaceae bacterium]